MPKTRLAERLQDLLIENDVLEDFLRQLSVLAAGFAAAETGRAVLCSVRVARRRRPVVLAAGHPEALVLDGLEDGLAEGPGLETRKTRQAVLVPDTTMDPRWRRYQRAVAQRGYRSVLALPLLEDRDAAATLTFFSTSPEAFDDGAVAACEWLAVRAAKVVRLAVRFESAHIGGVRVSAEDKVEGGARQRRLRRERPVRTLRADGVLDEGDRAAPGVRTRLHGVHDTDQHGQQADQVRHRNVAPQGSLALSAAQEHGHGFDQVARDAGEQSAPAGDGSQEVRFLTGHPHQRLDDPEETIGGIRPGEGLFDDGIDQQPELPVQCRKDQFFLVGEVPEQRGRADAGGNGDGLKRDFRAVLPEALAGGGDDLIDVPRGIGAERPAVCYPVHLLRLATRSLSREITTG